MIDKTRRKAVDLINRVVQFKIRDIYLPEPQEVLFELHSNDLVQGTVIDLSDHEMKEGSFAVIKVEGIEKPVVVSVRQVNPL